MLENHDMVAHRLKKDKHKYEPYKILGDKNLQIDIVSMVFTFFRVFVPICDDKDAEKFTLGLVL